MKYIPAAAGAPRDAVRSRYVADYLLNEQSVQHVERAECGEKSNEVVPARSRRADWHFASFIRSPGISCSTGAVSSELSRYRGHGDAVVYRKHQPATAPGNNRATSGRRPRRQLQPGRGRGGNHACGQVDEQQRLSPLVRCGASPTSAWRSANPRPSHWQSGRRTTSLWKLNTRGVSDPGQLERGAQVAERQADKSLQLIGGVVSP